VGIVALVMAGGKAGRMNSPVEKPLLEVGGKTMLERVVEVLNHSKSVDRIIVAVTKNTQKTARKAKELSLDLLETPGKNYEYDMQYAIKKLDLADVITICADLPFISVEIVDQAIEKFRSSRKPSLSVMAPVSVYNKLGLKPEYIFEVDGKMLVPIGINVIDGKQIDKPELEQAVLVTESHNLAINVNTPNELALADDLSKRS